MAATVSPVLSPNSQPMPAIPKVMSTAEKMEPSMSGGVALIKNNMRVMAESVKKVNAKAILIEDEVVLARKSYGTRAVKIAPLKMKIEDCEDRIRRNEEKIKERTRRLLEKEQLLQELKVFTKHLKKETPAEGAVAETEAKLRKAKAIYSENYRRYQYGREKRSHFDQRLEHAEIKGQEAERKIRQITLQLEQNTLEDRRKKLGCKKAIKDAAFAEKNIEDIERALDHVMLRKENALARIKYLEEAVSKTENDIDNHSYDRRRIEATLTELLVSSIREKDHAEHACET